jgi:hypothetical protein
MDREGVITAALQSGTCTMLAVQEKPTVYIPPRSLRHRTLATVAPAVRKLAGP